MAWMSIVLGWLLVGSLNLWADGVVTPLTVVDDRDIRITVPKPVRRIITLAPHATELVFAAGVDRYLVGVVAFSDYPPAAQQIACIGDAMRLNRETILSLRPDLVIAWPSGNRPQDLAWLKRHHLTLYHSDPATLEAIADNLRALGTLTATETAQIAAVTYSLRLANLRRRYTSTAAHPVFYQVWPRPVITLGPQHLVSQVLKLCGGRPLFPTLSGMAATVSKEAVILANPYAIIADATDPAQEPFAFWHRWPGLTAVKQQRLISIPADLLQRPTPRILDGAELLCRALQRD